jgi:hypothetical protein
MTPEIKEKIMEVILKYGTGKEEREWERRIKGDGERGHYGVEWLGSKTICQSGL